MFYLTKNLKMRTIARLSLASLLLTITHMSCTNAPEKTTETATAATAVSKQDFGQADGKPVYLYTLTNKNGAAVKITNYGGIVTSWVAPDKNGSKSSIVLGFDSLSGYLAKPPYFGALVGRYGNRIANGKFKIGDSSYTLATNNGKNHLHGGLKGFDKVVWDAAMVDSVPALTLTYTSKDGEEGYPGNLKVTVVYTLSDDNELGIEYSAETDKPTVLNLTNHSYFNLTGSVENNILHHALKINADAYTPVDSTLIPTGLLQPVKGTPFDFTTATAIGARIGNVPGGYDHNFVLNSKDGSLQLAAVLLDSLSGRKLEVYTTQPGLQFYTGNFLDGSIKTSDGKAINKNAALCMETQHFPDSPNQPSFPSTLLKPGEKYHSITKYKLSLQ
jgi:aldose 1-epimerase